MKLLVASGCVLFLLWSPWSVSFAQNPQQSSSGQTTIRVQTSLVLVDVISQENGLPVRDFKKEDFRMLDDGKEVPIRAFDAGARYDTRPVIVWLVVICNEGGKIGGSAEFVGNEAMFRPAFDQLDNRDSVGVAHWCDNGEAQLDLVPTRDRDQPLRVLAETIKPIPFHIDRSSNLVGEAMFRKMIRLIIQDAHRRNPQPLPVIVFLDGDHTGQPQGPLDEVVDDFLETSGIVFGIKDSHAPVVPMLTNGEVTEIEHYIAQQTGGQYFVASPEHYAVALEAILMQLHFRYELGFVPPVIDGRRHKIKVELTKGAREQHKGVRLRFRPEYIAVSELPDWAR
jgi:hypothetical protein